MPGVRTHTNNVTEACESIAQRNYIYNPPLDSMQLPMGSPLVIVNLNEINSFQFTRGLRFDNCRFNLFNLLSFLSRISECILWSRQYSQSLNA